MRRAKIPICLIMGLSLLSCSAVRPGGTEALSGRLFQSGYSVVPPREKGWAIVDRDSYRLMLARPGPSLGESYVAVASLVLLPSDLDDRELFLEHIRLARSKEYASNGIRILSNEESLFNEKGDYCVRYRSESVTGSGNPETLVNEAIGFYCRHPAETTIAIKAEYSYRHHVENEDRDLEEKARRFLEAVNFESLTVN
jgi:hypothetical protein